MGVYLWRYHGRRRYSDDEVGDKEPPVDMRAGDKVTSGIEQGGESINRIKREIIYRDRTFGISSREEHHDSRRHEEGISNGRNESNQDRRKDRMDA